MDTPTELDHSYSRHWSESYKTDHSHAKPIHWLLSSCRSERLAKGSRLRSQHMNASANNTSSDGSDDEIDVESLDEVMEPYVSGRTYDAHRARANMNETEKFTTQSLLPGKMSSAAMRSELDWEDYINKSSWSMQQTRLFTKVVKILEDEKLARLAFKGVNNEPIARRLSLDRSASCLRRILAEFLWDQKLTQWLHFILIRRLPASMLASYLDLVQTLRSKVPTLVERMIAQSATESEPGAMDCLNVLLKRPWEPTLVKHLQNPKQKLYDSPIILLIPNSPYAPSPTMAHRKRFWNSHLGQLGKIVMIGSPEKVEGMTILSYIEQLSTAVRSRINLYHNKYPNKSIILAGWHTASILSCHIALVEKVSAVLCLGFPMQTLNGSRGTVDDVFCDLNTPILFVVGEEADSCDIDQLEDFREKLLTHCQSSLLAVPGADDALRVSDKVKKTACVTQTMVDKMILDYVESFLSDTLKKNEVETWRITESNIPVGFYQPKHKGEGKRKRVHVDEEIGEIKRRRLSSTTTAKISEILSGQSSSRGRDGTKSPVHGVTYNLQTGSMSGLATVPTVLGRSLSKNGDSSSSLALKHGKVSQKNRNQQRSITIDLAKDNSHRLKSRKTGMPPDPALLATESQTEAAVATILGGNTTEPKVLPSTPDVTSNTTPPESPIPMSNASTSTGLSTANPTTVTTPSLQTSSQMSTSIANTGFYPTARVKPSYSNVKFSSTVLPSKQPDTVRESSINHKLWTGMGITNPSLTTSNSSLAKKYPYLTSQNPVELSSQQSLSSRSRKEERETMQATAFLEQLTSGDAGSSSSVLGELADAASYRRHSYDSTHLAERGIPGRGRGRVRTRGGPSSQSSNPRPVPPKRRKTINEERPRTYYQQGQQQSRQESYVRYVMTTEMSTMLTNAAAKSIQSNAKGFAKPLTTSQQVTLVTDSSKPKTLMASKPAPKPALIPVYAYTQGQPAISNVTKVQHLAQPTRITKVTQARPGIASQVAEVKKSPKVFLSQRVPVKFPGAAPGSSYTFVTIPALVGPALPQARPKAPHGNIRKVVAPPSLRQPTANSKVVEKTVKYSVFPRKDITITTAPLSSANLKATTSANTRIQQPLVSLRDKALAKPSEVSKVQNSVSMATTVVSAVNPPPIPVFTSPSVVLQKLWSDTVAELGTSSDPNNDSK